MTTTEREMLNQALGRADAALNLAKLLMQLLVNAKIMPADDVLEAIDMSALSAVESLSTSRGSNAKYVQIRVLRTMLEGLAELPGWQNADTAKRTA